MQRFGRTAQTKMKDGWGGSFVLVAIMLVGVAWWGGNKLNQWTNRTDLVGSDPAGVSEKSGDGAAAPISDPHQFQLYMVQVGAFRSESKARELVYTLADHNYPAMSTPRDSAGWSHVYAGAYTTKESADDIRSKLVADGIATEAYTRTVTVDHNPDAVPAMSSASKPADVKTGLDALNTYLYEVAVWMENRAAGAETDTTVIASLGAKLSNLATAMSSETDESVKQFAAVAQAAGENATAIEKAASASVSSDEYQSAISGYLSLLEQYRALQPTE